MDINYNNDFNSFNNKYLENIESYISVNKEIYENLVSQINFNFLLIVFTLSCVSGFIFCIKKQNDGYLLVKTNHNTNNDTSNNTNILVHGYLVD